MKEFMSLIINVFSITLCLVFTWFLFNSISTDDSEHYRCDNLENGTIVDANVYEGIFNTTYTLVICDDSLEAKVKENRVDVSPDTYSEYEQGKIDKIENWE